MPADKDYLEYVMELFADVEGVRSRAMFGGYGIFHYDKMFALIAGSRLYFKVGDSNIESFEKAGSPQFRTMPYYEVPADVLEDSNRFTEWALAAIAVGDTAPANKKRSSRRSGT